MIDLSKLTPAPWTTKSEHRDIEDYVYGPKGFPLLMPESDDEEGFAALKFAALARNAFDIMMRRGWNAIQQPDETWGVFWPDYQSGDLVVDAGKGFRFFANPFTALVEADKWYAANVEGLTPGREAGKIGDAKDPRECKSPGQ